MMRLRTKADDRRATLATYILVSGAWHAGWCWERVVPLLEEAGHHTVAPDLLGMGADKTPLSEVTLARWADQIAEIILRLDDRVVLVGHSRGGIIISEVAERVPNRIATLVYVAAFLIPSGETLAVSAARVPRDESPDMLVPTGEGATIINTDAVGPTFYNLTDAGWVERARVQVGPEPMAAFSTPLRLSEAKFGSVPRAYIECMQDNAVPLELQRLMQRALPCDPVFTLDTDHSPFYSAPDQLANSLLQVGLKDRHHESPLTARYGLRPIALRIAPK